MDTTQFDLDFRPESYWPFEDPDAGKAANEMTYRIRRAEQTGDWSRVVFPPVPFALRGGDFLPRGGKFEIEIARVSLESTTWDVISIRARPTKSGIRYRIVDEYGSDITSSRKSSKRPLTLHQIIELIDSMQGNGEPGSPAAIRNCRASFLSVEDVDGMATFVHVDSDFYPQLTEWYVAEAEEWRAKTIAQIPIAKRRVQEDEQRKLDKFLRLLRRLAEQAKRGDIKSMNRLGLHYFFAERKADAFNLWSRAKEAGDESAALRVASCLLRGEGVKQDRNKAFRMYRKQAERSCDTAALAIGYCYLYGLGVTKNAEKAITWVRKAVEMDDQNYDYLLDCLLLVGLGTKLTQETLGWFEGRVQAKCRRTRSVRQRCHFEAMLKKIDKIRSGERSRIDTNMKRALDGLISGTYGEGKDGLGPLSVWLREDGSMAYMHYEYERSLEGESKSLFHV